jgi:hypothetical protein
VAVATGGKGVAADAVADHPIACMHLLAPLLITSEGFIVAASPIVSARRTD